MFCLWGSWYSKQSAWTDSFNAKICPRSRYFEQNVSKYEGLVWRPKFWQKLFNISRFISYFSKPIFALKPSDSPYLKVVRQLRNFLDLFSISCTIQITIRHIEKSIFFIFQHTILHKVWQSISNGNPYIGFTKRNIPTWLMCGYMNVVWCLSGKCQTCACRMHRDVWNSQ